MMLKRKKNMKDYKKKTHEFLEVKRKKRKL